MSDEAIDEAVLNRLRDESGDNSGADPEDEREKRQRPGTLDWLWRIFTLRRWIVAAQR